MVDSTLPIDSSWSVLKRPQPALLPFGHQRLLLRLQNAQQKTQAACLRQYVGTYRTKGLGLAKLRIRAINWSRGSILCYHVGTL